MNARKFFIQIRSKETGNWEPVKPKKGEVHIFSSRKEADGCIKACWPEELRKAKMGIPPQARVREFTGYLDVVQKVPKKIKQKREVRPS